MKIFFGTSFFWILLLAVFLFVTGWGGIMKPLFDQSYLVNWMPDSVNSKLVDKGIKIGTELGIEQCPKIVGNTSNQSGNVGNVDDPSITIDTDGVVDAMTLPAQVPSEFQQPDLATIQIDIAGIRENMNKQFVELLSAMSKCGVTATTGEKVLSPEEKAEAERLAKQARLVEIQAQVDKLLKEMNSIE